MSMGAFGKTFDQEMREAGFDVYTFVAGGATPYYWLSRYSTITGPIGYWEKTPGGEQRENVARGVPKVESLLERYDPDVVVVQTGTNLYSTLRSKRSSPGVMPGPNTIQLCAPSVSRSNTVSAPSPRAKR